MAGIEAPEYQVNVSQENSINKFAVQGEENSRVLTLHLVETVQTVTALGETVIRQNPLDLTGCTVRLYVKKPDGNATFTDGTIVDTGASGTQNTVTFVLSQQTTAAAGNAHCTVAVFGSNGTELKATGITLNIAADDMEQTIVSTSEFVSLAEALNKAESAEKIAEDSAVEINQTVSAASTELQSLKTQSSDIATAETARVDAEGKRVTAESDRVAAEGKRQTAETARSDAESQRTSNESTRQATEAARAAAESSRASEESKRATAETARASAEQTRVQQESGRATAETVRADAESKRATSETVRSDAEGKRATAEQGRVDAESARVTAEQTRQAAETKRESDAQAAVSSANAAAGSATTAASNANTAADRANSAAQAAEGVVNEDLLIDKLDGTAGYNTLYTDVTVSVPAGTATQVESLRTADATPTVKLHGNSTQAGTPTPDAPVPIVSVQSPITATVMHKNLLPISTFSTSWNGITITNHANGSYTFNGTANADADLNFVSFPFAISNANTYTFSVATVLPVKAFLSINNQSSTILNSSHSSLTFAGSSAMHYAILRVDTGAVFNNYLLKPQLEIGDTATAWEAPNISTVSIPLTAADTTAYPDPLELRATDANHSDKIALDTDGRWKIFRYTEFYIFNNTFSSGFYSNKYLTSGTYVLPILSHHASSGAQIGYFTLGGYCPDWNGIPRITLDAEKVNALLNIPSDTTTAVSGYIVPWLKQSNAQALFPSDVHGTATPKCWKIIDLSSDTQTALTNLRTAIAPLASGTTLTITSSAKMDIISRGKFHQQQDTNDYATDDRAELRAEIVALQATIAQLKANNNLT